MSQKKCKHKWKEDDTYYITDITNGETTKVTRKKCSVCSEVKKEEKKAERNPNFPVGQSQQRTVSITPVDDNPFVLEMSSRKPRRNTRSIRMSEKPKADEQIVEKKYKVVQVGWDGENNRTPIVLLSLKERQALDVDVASVVKVKKGRVHKLAIVQIQFKAHLRAKDVCTLNSKVSTDLNASVDDNVKISKEVTESEAKEFHREHIPANPLMAMLGGLR